MKLLVTQFKLLLFQWMSLWIRPSQWRKQLNDIDSSLNVNFALLDLKERHWRSPKLRHILGLGFIAMPCLVVAFFASIAIAAGYQLPGSLHGVFFVFALGITIALYASVPAGIMFIPVAAAAAIFQWSGPNTLVQDITTTTSIGVLLSLASGCTIIAGAVHADNRSKLTISRQAGAITLGLLISIPLVAFVTYSVFITTAGRQTGTLAGGAMIWVMTLPTTLILAIATYIRTKSFLKVLFSIVFCAAVISTSYSDLGYEYDRGTGGFHLLAVTMMIVCTTYCMLSIFTYTLTRPFVGDWPAAVAGAIGGISLFFGIKTSFTYFPIVENLAIAVAILILAMGYRHTWSIFAYPIESAWNKIVTLRDDRHHGAIRHFNLHTACWDEIQYLRLHELDDYLISSISRDTIIGNIHLDQIRDTNQQWAAQSATLELTARDQESLPDIHALANYSEDLSAGLIDTPTGLIHRSFTRLARDIHAALSQTTNYNQILVLRSVLKDIEDLQLELTRNYNDKSAGRFMSVSRHWHNIVQSHIGDLEQARKINQEIPNPYIVGVPLTRKQGIFVGRTNTARYLEGILKVQDHPPLLLYGPRRMGKTSLLYQLHWMLPYNILPVIVDLQGPVSLTTNDSGFVFALARGMRLAAERQDVLLPALSRDQVKNDPFIAFDEWLDIVESILYSQGRNTLLLAMDEFEALDVALVNGTLRDHAILGMFRHIAQHRRSIKLMLVGSHTLGEFRRWSTYFVNAQIIELGYLEKTDIDTLVTRPIADFPLSYQPAAISRITHLTRGHPYLLQLACAEIVAYKNEQPFSERQIATEDDVNKIIPQILQGGQQFFTDIELNQIDDYGRQCLLQLADMTPGSSTQLSLEKDTPAFKEFDTIAKLQQRNLIELNSDNQCRFQIEVVKYWFSRSNPYR